MLSTLATDVFSIYCVLPASVSGRIPQAFANSILNDRAGQLFNSLKDSGLKSLVSSLCKFLLGGGLLAQVITQLQSQGIWTVGANLLTMVSSFRSKVYSLELETGRCLICNGYQTGNLRMQGELMCGEHPAGDGPSPERQEEAEKLARFFERTSP